MDRRTHLRQLATVGLLPFATPFMADTIRKRTIPSSGEELPVVGVGTWRTFDVDNSNEEKNPLKDVLKNLVAKNARVVDSSPMYGRSESVVGDLSTQLGLNDKLFIATKVWTSGKENGIQQMNESFEKMKRKQIDLMQIHNLVDWQTHLKTLREWKEQKRIRYIGITHYSETAYSTIEQILKSEPLDFLQINYSLGSRHADERLLPLAKDKNVAVIINRPFMEGALFKYVSGKALPEFAKEFDCKSWAQFFLKFIISHPAVNCPIPGTSNPVHMLDNLGAAFGRLPDERMRVRMIQAIA